MIAAASRVFAAKGFAGAGMAEIASAAELSLASLYGVFRSKEGLYQEVIHSAARAVQKAVQERVDRETRPGERLLCLIDALLDCFEENRDLLGIVFRGTHGLPWRLRDAMGPPAEDVVAEFEGWVVELAREAHGHGDLTCADPEVFARALLGAVTSTAAHWIEMRPSRPLAPVAGDLRRIFARALEGGEG